MTSTQTYLDLLAEEGYRPKISESNPAEIHFKVEGVRFRAYVDPNDDGFVALVLTYNAPEGAGLDALLRAVNRVNDDYKVVKATVTEDASTVRFAFEALTSGTLPTEILGRAISVLRYASDRYFEKLREEEPQAQA